MKPAHSSSLCGCCGSMGRRDFMTAVGSSALALKAAATGFASTGATVQPAIQARPRIRAVFLRPKVDRYWMGWPGASYDIAGRQADAALRWNWRWTTSPTPATAKGSISCSSSASQILCKGPSPSFRASRLCRYKTPACRTSREPTTEIDCAALRRRSTRDRRTTQTANRESRAAVLRPHPPLLQRRPA
jgi:hypothetical protein